LTHQIAEGFQKMALGGGSQECRGNAFAHNVAHDHVEAVAGMTNEDVEIAIDAL
jgi:hypothetical protein